MKEDDRPPQSGTLINRFQACPTCHSTDSLEVRNHSLMWHDGEVWCGKCDIYVRSYDAG